MRNLVLLFLLPLLATAQTTVIQRGGGGGVSVDAGSGISLATNGSVVTISATGIATNAQPPSTQLTNLSNGAVYANTNYTTNLLVGFGTNNFLLGQFRTNIVTNSFIVDYIFSPSLVAIYDANRMLTSSVVTSAELLHLSGVTGGIQTNLNNRQPSNATLTQLSGLADTNLLATLGQLQLYAQEQAFTNASVSGGNLIVDMRTNAAGYVECTPGAAFTLILTNAPTSGRAKAVTVFLKGDGTDRTMTLQTKAGAATLTNRVGAAFTTTYVITNNQQFVLTLLAKPNAANATDMTNIVYAIAPNLP